jgi:hypothetical protein
MAIGRSDQEFSGTLCKVSVVLARLNKNAAGLEPAA